MDYYYSVGGTYYLSTYICRRSFYAHISRFYFGSYENIAIWINLHFETTWQIHLIAIKACLSIRGVLAILLTLVSFPLTWTVHRLR